MIDLTGADLTSLFTAELELCAVRKRESLVVLTEPSSRGDYAAAAFAAARGLGADVALLTLPGGSPAPLPSARTGTSYGLLSLEHNQAAQDLLKAVDFVVDLTLEGMAHTPFLGDILHAGTRMLYVCEPPDVLSRSLPKPQDKETAQKAAERLGRAKSMHVVSQAGTDLRVSLEDSHPMFQCGFADEPGRWDHWPATMVLCWPRTSGVQGTLVFDVGDVIFPLKEYVSSPVSLVIEAGRITDIGGGLEAVMLRTFFDHAGDDAARMISHIGWGLMTSADWLSLGMYDKGSVVGMDARAAAGNFLISTGPHLVENRWTPYHLDLPMRNCTVSLDGVPVTCEGVLV
ncbi:hypothetical protein [Streptomyces sp. FIT100]|uniref:hypothetical protein n=1 Tax=Streptomyces sp. FIT100 TaxID=2837956 RepID=UPI0021CAC0B8|nr:hypothetical protein [Streptomyces sp. FIT100]UUN30175.1 hypothetical protein KK483_30310 [Streptomyces sp. FIT100]